VTIVRPACSDDLRAIEALRRADGDCLGFIPKQRYEHIVNQTLDRGRPRWTYEWLLVSEDNTDVTGFVLASFGREGMKAEQVCVRRDARRMERALLLVGTVELEAVRRHMNRARCRVAYDIEANAFWLAAGWEAVATVTSTWLNIRESKCKRPLIVYDKVLCQPRLFNARQPFIVVTPTGELVSGALAGRCITEPSSAEG